MELIITFASLAYLFFFFASYNSISIVNKFIFICLFLVSTFVLRFLINPDLNKDYAGYFELRDFSSIDSFSSFLMSEPYLFLVFNFFNFFTNDRVLIFLEIYWLNFLITNAFFIWLLTRNDVQMWKKMVLFVFYYFLIGFVLLRNGPVYIIFGLFFYYSFRGVNYNKILLTPFFHISSVPLLILLFNKKKFFFLYFILLLLFLVPMLVFFVVPMISNVMALESSISKVDSYSKGMEVVSVFHKIYLIFISLIFIVSFLIYKKKVFHPILITTFVLYFIGFLINPVVGFRFTPYIFLSILLFNFDGKYNLMFTRFLNVASFFLFPYFLYSLFDTHYL